MYSYPHKTAYRELADISFSDYIKLLPAFGNSLYVHVPFCASKCGYCNLFSVSGQSEDYMADYLLACETQFTQYAVPLTSFDVLTIGGGDPLILSPMLLERLLSLGGHNLKICLETSPNATTLEKLAILKSFPIDRVSIGIQSFSDTELIKLRRFHDSVAVKKALALLKSSGFPCINLDLIYGIPGQTLRTLEESLAQAINFAPDEIFIYPLYIRSGTGLSEEIADENTQLKYDMYCLARDFLPAAGYFQVSMRQFVKKVPLNQKSCGFENMLALGCGGRSYLGNLHFCHPYAVGRRECLRIIDDFIKMRDKTEIRHGFILNQDELKRRFVIKNLLYYAGLCVSEYKDIFESTIFDDFPLIKRLVSDGYAEIFADYIKLTQLGLSFSDYIGSLFISDNVKGKMAAWKNK